MTVCINKRFSDVSCINIGLYLYHQIILRTKLSNLRMLSIKNCVFKLSRYIVILIIFFGD